jgi:hypothetical protein
MNPAWPGTMYPVVEHFGRASHEYVYPLRRQPVQYRLPFKKGYLEKVVI